MARPKNSKDWLREHFDDAYVLQAQQQGYRSRASYKLIELCDKDALLRPGMTVVDLGAAPGGWSQVAAQRVAPDGRVIAADILSMDAIAGVEFLQGDFTEQQTLEGLLACIGDQGAHLVMSDMAPNMSGNKVIDQPAMMGLVELAFDLAATILQPNGVFIAKLFHGAGFDEFVKMVKQQYSRVVMRKPAASRARSREVYIVAHGYQG